MRATGLPQPIAQYNLTGQAGESWMNAPKVEHTLKEPLLALPMAVLRPCTMTMSSSGEHAAAAADALAPHWRLDTSCLRPTAQLWAGVRWPNITLTLCIVESPRKYTAAHKAAPRDLKEREREREGAREREREEVLNPLTVTITRLDEWTNVSYCWSAELFLVVKLDTNI